MRRSEVVVIGNPTLLLDTNILSFRTRVHGLARTRYLSTGLQPNRARYLGCPKVRSAHLRFSVEVGIAKLNQLELRCVFEVHATFDNRFDSRVCFD